MTAKKHRRDRRLDATGLTPRVPWQVTTVSWLACAALLTAVVYTGNRYTSTLVKVVLFQMLTAASLAVWLPLAITDRRFRPNWRNPLVVAATVYIAVFGLATIFSLEPATSFWSNLDRMAGFINYFHYWLWFIILAATQKNWEAWRRLLNWVNGVALTIDALGLFLWLPMQKGARLLSSIENPLEMATYAFVAAVATAYLLVRSRERYQKIFFGFSLFLHLLIIVLTGSRSGVLGLVVAAAVLTGWFLTASLVKRQNKKLAGLVIIGLVVAAAGVAWLRSPNGGGRLENKLPSWFTRVVMTTDYGQDRSVLADVAWQSFKERPPLGWGPEMFEAAYERHFDPQGPTGTLLEQWYDRSHNQFMDELAMRGALGLAAYLALWGAAFILLFRRLRQGDEDETATVLLVGGLAGYLLILMFGFESPNSSVLAWLLLALVAGPLASRTEIAEPRPTDNNANLANATWMLLAIVIVIEGTAFVRPLWHIETIGSACRTLRSNPPAAIKEMSATLAKRTFVSPEASLEVASCLDPLIVSTASTDLRLAAAQAAYAGVSAALAEKPLDYRFRDTAIYYHLLYAHLDKTKLDDVLQDVTAAENVQPNRFRNHELAADVQFEKGEYAAAADELEEALVLAPRAIDRAKLHQPLARAYALMGNYPAALANLRLTISDNLAAGYPPLAAADPKLAAPLAAAMPTGSAYSDPVVQFYDRLAELYPKNGPVLANRIKALSKMNGVAPEKTRTACADLAEADDSLVKEFANVCP